MFVIRTIESAYFPIQYKELAIIAIITFLLYGCIVKKESEKGQKWMSGKKIVVGILFSVYMALLWGGALINRVIGEGFEIKLIPFWSYYEALVKQNLSIGLQIIYNIVVFIPWGMLLPFTTRKGERFRTFLWVTVVFAVLVEMLQFVFRCGTCEFDDVFSNVLGAIFGYSIWKLCFARRKL